MCIRDRLANYALLDSLMLIRRQTPEKHQRKHVDTQARPGAALQCASAGSGATEQRAAPQGGHHPPQDGHTDALELSPSGAVEGIQPTARVPG
eukprot:11151193-Alexandrium_andersonii.AAC.2